VGEQGVGHVTLIPHQGANSWAGPTAELHGAYHRRKGEWGGLIQSSKRETGVIDSVDKGVGRKVVLPNFRDIMPIEIRKSVSPTTGVLAPWGCT